MTSSATAWDQGSYQVRFDWGLAGLRRLAPAAITVVVDVLDASPEVSQQIDRDAVAQGGTVFLGSLRNAKAVAQAALADQVNRGVRTSIAVIAVPAATGQGEGYAVENLLGAGAVIDALATLGADHSSPEAAVACEGFAGLRQAVGHLISASGAGRALAALGRADQVARASNLNDSDVVPVIAR